MRLRHTRTSSLSLRLTIFSETITGNGHARSTWSAEKPKQKRSKYNGVKKISITIGSTKDQRLKMVVSTKEQTGSSSKKSLKPQSL